MKKEKNNPDEREAALNNNRNKEKTFNVISPTGKEIPFYDMTDYLEQLRREEFDKEIDDIG